MKYWIFAHAALVLSIIFVGSVAAQTHGHGEHRSVAPKPGEMKKMDHGAKAPGRHHPSHGTMKMDGGEIPNSLDTSTSKLSRHKHYKVSITARPRKVAINVMHSWILDIVMPDGRPVKGANVTVDGGMPNHGHGLPTSPRITKQLGDGRYLVEGMKFNMAGWWQLRFGIESGHHKDRVTFNLVLK